jgi:hypothetical protein
MVAGGPFCYDVVPDNIGRKLPQIDAAFQDLGVAMRSLQR